MLIRNLIQKRPEFTPAGSKFVRRGSVSAGRLMECNDDPFSVLVWCPLEMHSRWRGAAATEAPRANVKESIAVRFIGLPDRGLIEKSQKRKILLNLSQYDKNNQKIEGATKTAAKIWITRPKEFVPIKFLICQMCLSFVTRVLFHKFPDEHNSITSHHVRGKMRCFYWNRYLSWYDVIWSTLNWSYIANGLLKRVLNFSTPSMYNLAIH